MQIIRNYVAGAAVGARRIVKHGSFDTQVILGAAATDSVIGITTDIAAASGERCDVIHGGVAEITAGAAFPRGAMLVSDANGAAVGAAPGGGVNHRHVAIALEAAALAGDIVPVLVLPGQLQG